MAEAGLSKETKMSIEASSMFPGFRFSPTDVELISYYLKKKMEGAHQCVEVIPEVEFCRNEPWDLPAKSVIQSDTEWFFFAARGRKYPNGSQSKRATELGYWKATGKERYVKSGSDVIGTKRTLVFHLGRAPKGERTEWIMHEYCMSGSSQDSLVVCRLRKNLEFRLNDASSRPSLNPSNFSRAEDCSHTASGSDADRIGGSEMHKAAECESHSIEQFDSASETEQKQSNDISLTESSSRQKDSDNEEDFYADILKDDIVKLDETPLFAAASGFLPVVVSNTATVSNAWVPAESMVSQALPLQTIPLQGTASQRIKLKRRIVSAPLAQAPKSNASKHQPEENNERSRPEEQPKCVIGLQSIDPWLIPVVSIIVLIVVVLLLYLLGGPQQVIRRIAHATLYKAS